MMATVGRRKKAPKAPEGFKSAEALGRLRRVAIVAGAAPIILFVLAYAGIIATAFMGAGMDHVDKAFAYGVVARSDGFYYVEGGSRKNATLQLKRKSLDASGTGSDASLATFVGDLDGTFLLNDPVQQRVWVLSNGETGYWQNGHLTWLSVSQGWKDMSRPFLWSGQPAFLDEAGGACDIWRFEKDAWKRELTLNLSELDSAKVDACNCHDVRLVRHNDQWQWFFLDQKKLRSFQGLPSGKWLDPHRWQSISQDSAAKNWAPMSLKAGLFVADHNANGDVRLWKQQAATWNFQTYGHGDDDTIGLMEGATGEPLLAMAGTGLTLHHVDDSPGADVTLLKKAKVPPPFLMLIPFLLLIGVMLVSPLIAVAILDRESRRARPDTLKLGRAPVALAGLLRRAGARVIDGLLVAIVALPLGIGCAFGLGLFHDVENHPLKLFSGILIVVLFSLAGLGLLFVQEGRSGLTPGRQAMGIRLLGVDQKPCGLGRALLRGLLVFVDSQFFWLPGVLTAALSKRQQRLGDMAADTVVIRSKS